MAHLTKEDFTLSRVQERDLLIFEAIAGSRSFGTHHVGSDIDIRGVFVAPDSFLTGLETIEQVSDEKNDTVYYEVGRFISLLLSNNPNIIELLFTPEDCLKFTSPVFSLIQAKDFLSQKCRESFGNYAMGQIRKARGLNKKIVNPEPEERRHLRDFCHVLVGQGTVPLVDWLAQQNLSEESCALISVSHAPGIYAVFNLPEGRGIFSKKDDQALICSSVPKGSTPLVWMHCNVDSWKRHCRSHKEYWKWVQLRNEERYRTNTAHGRGYDSKNLMHTLRLLEQATEIAQEGSIVLPRRNADWLKQVKGGHYDYEDLLKIAEEKHAEMEQAFETSDLIAEPCRLKAESVLNEIRMEHRGPTGTHRISS